MAFKVGFIKSKQGEKAGRSSTGMLAALLSLFLLTACPTPNPSCIDADDWGDTENLIIKIDPTKKFSPSGISVTSGEPLSVEISGAVDLCPTIDGSTPNQITPAIAGWQDSGQTVIEGEKLLITISGSYVDRTGTQDGGRGLYAYIAPEGADINAANSKWWYGKEDKNASANNRLAMDSATSCHPDPADSSKCNPFFELYDNGTTGAGGSGFSGTAPASGKLYFRYARSANDRGMDDSGGSRHSPWRGVYRWDSESNCNACRQTTITAACVASGPFYPVCIAGWESGCAATKHLEYNPIASTNQYKSSKCQEWYGSGSEHRTGGYWGDYGFDHWVDENAVAPDSKATGPYNTGTGYDINISKGCPGTFGKYAKMIIGESSYPMGGSEPIVSGTPIDMNSSGTQPDGTVSDPILPPGFTGVGVYDVTRAPTSGEIWFEIDDGATETSDTAKPGGDYTDNIGSYEAHIRTTKVDSNVSSFLNGLINPMRKIIFGYCNGGDGSETETNCTSDKWSPGITQRMYNTLVTNNMVISAVRAGLVLMITIYGMLFMMGMIKDVQEDFVKKVIKIAIISTLIGPSSWEFFNQYLFTFFIDGMNQLIGILAGEFMGSASITGDNMSVASVSNPFAFIDGTMSKFMNSNTLIKLLGLLFSSPLGFLYVAGMLAGIFFFLFAVLRAAILYILAMLVISLLLAVAPIFISFLMFERTKGYFDNWIKSLMSYLFQPVLVFTALAIFNVFVYSAIYSLLHYQVCWDTVIGFGKGEFLGISDEVSLFKFYMPSGGQDGGALLSSGMPIGFFMILIFIIITNAMLKFVDFVAELTGHLTIGNAGTSLSNAAAATTASGGGILKGVTSRTVSLAGDTGKAAGNAAAKKVGNAVAKRAGGAKEGK